MESRRTQNSELSTTGTNTWVMNTQCIYLNSIVSIPIYVTSVHFKRSWQKTVRLRQVSRNLSHFASSPNCFDIPTSYTNFREVTLQTHLWWLIFQSKMIQTNQNYISLTSQWNKETFGYLEIFISNFEILWSRDLFFRDLAWPLSHRNLHFCLQTK